MWGNGFGKDGFEQRTAGRAQKQPAFADVGEIHRRIGNGEPVEPGPEGRVVVEPEADVIDRLGGPRNRCLDCR